MRSVRAWRPWGSTGTRPQTWSTRLTRKSELREALRESPARAAEELGDLLFSLANLARKLDIEPGVRAREANDKFTRRFDQLEAWMAARGRSVHGTPLTELEEAWQAVKALPAKDATPARSGRTRTARIPSGRRSRSPRRRRDRSEDRGTRRAQPVQDGGRRMAKEIACPDTDHGDLRPQRVHQHSACG